MAADGLSESFALTVPLVRAGEVSAVAVDAVVSGAMSTRGIADFTAYFASVSVQPGIVWESASDTFLSQPVPEPGTWLMLVAGGAALAVRLRHRGARANDELG